jgi:transcriptional/translational regulatory protein YebC/TACO1
VRSIFSKQNGNLGGPGSVSYLFDRKGQILVPCNSMEEEKLFEIALNAGAEEFTSDDSFFTVLTAPDQLYAIAEKLKQADISIESHTLTFLPQNTIHITDTSTASQILRLCEALEDCDDVLHVHSNFDIPEEILLQTSLD